MKQNATKNKKRPYKCSRPLNSTLPSGMLDNCEFKKGSTFFETIENICKDMTNVFGWTIAGCKNKNENKSGGKKGGNGFNRAVEQWKTTNQLCKKILRSKPKWGNWMCDDKCNKKCGSGMKTCVRFCLNGNQGDPGCDGPKEKQELCDLPKCCIPWEWEEWSVCDQSCGSGHRSRIRHCEFDLNGIKGGECCQGRDSESEMCNTQACRSIDCPFNGNNRICDGSDRCGLNHFEECIDTKVFKLYFQYHLNFN